VEGVIADLAASGLTMIVVTHSMRLARRAAHTLHVFESGRVLESGPPEQIFDSPRHEATRRFLSEVDGR
jgi:ABC-type polar amino acid transport system ATPase subunit